MLARTTATGRSPRQGLSLIEILVIILIVGLLIGFLLLPVTRDVRPAVRRSACKNHLKQIGLALHNYHDEYGSFPPAYTVDADGRRLHSWRTLILPFIDEGPLYSQIDLAQPWDSPANAALHADIPECYRCPSAESPRGETTYVAVVDAQTVWPGAESCQLKDITDGTSNTILVIECVNAHIHWMEPRDLTLDMALTGLNSDATGSPSSGHVGGWHVLVSDGAVRFVSENIPLDGLSKLLRRNDGGAIQVEEW